MNRSLAAVVSAALVLAATAACIPADSDARPERVPETAEEGPQVPDEPVVPEGEAFVVEPLEEIDGAETWRTDGIVLEVPPGMQTERAEDADGVVTLVVFDEDADRDGVAVHVEAGEEVTEEMVDLATRGAGSVAWIAGGSDLVRTDTE